MFFDTHAHYDDPRFDGDRDSLLAALPERGVGLVVDCGSDIPTSLSALELSRRYPHVYCACGIHPESAGEYTEEDLARVERLCREEKVVAVGEIGLDYHYADGAPREVQIRLLRAQLRLALDLDLPVVIHDREAHGDCLETVRAFPGLRGVFHCYSGSAEMAAELVKLGWMFSFGGSVTFKNNKKAPEVIASLPADRIMLETDCPYLAPVPYRGRRCDSTLLTYVCEAVARFRGIAPGEAEELTWNNARRFFGV
jgi:TatD DNase family protein